MYGQIAAAIIFEALWAHKKKTGKRRFLKIFFFLSLKNSSWGIILISLQLYHRLQEVQFTEKPSFLVLPT